MNAQAQTERDLLATLMLRPGDCWGVDIAPEHFTAEANGDLLHRIRTLTADGMPCDPVSVADSFERDGKRDMASLALTIASSSLTTTQPSAFADRIRSSWRLRQAHAIAADLHGATDAAAIDSAIERLMSLHATETRHEWSAKDAVRKTVDELQAIEAGTAPKPVTTGLRDLDLIIGGFHRGDLIVIGARPAMGKTSLALGMAHAAAKGGCPVGVVSGEQPIEQVSARWLSLAASVPATNFRSGFEEGQWGRVSDAMVRVASLPMWVYDRSAPSLAECVRIARRWKHKHDIRALYVDYLQRIEAEGERKFEQVGHVVRGLKNLARDLDIPVIVPAQVSRKVEDCKPPIPRMGHLSDSSEIEKEADQVLMLYRDEHYNPNTDKRGVAQIIVEKNRHGPTGFIECSFSGETMRFADLAKADPYWGEAA